MSNAAQWSRYHRYLCIAEDIGLRVDVSRMLFAVDLFETMAEPIAQAITAMEALERGERINADENRMVGHYWLRDPLLAPTEAIRAAIVKTLEEVKNFSGAVHDGRITPQKGEGFYVVLVIGIGGSALGPQFVADALGSADDPMILRFLDNTDPAGMDRMLAELDESLGQTLTLVVSKSGGTIETRNTMLEVAAAYERRGLRFARHAVAITCEHSALYERAVKEQWLATFPMWDWVGGRTSELSAVGLLPAALQGVDLDAMLAGARDCDVVNRNSEMRQNPAAVLALMWYDAVKIRKKSEMVVLPYTDRLALLGRYLQQLIMESLGKALDRKGREVHEGITVFGHKGTTDQHSFVQQLQQGPNRFFVTFVEVLHDRDAASLAVEENVTSGDFLSAFLQGTRAALYDVGRESLTITVNRLDAQSVGALIALFERAVGLYAELIDVNAYHQPGVELGKKAASGTIALQQAVMAHLRTTPGTFQTVEEIATAISREETTETIYHILEHATANEDHGIIRQAGQTPFTARYGVN